MHAVSKTLNLLWQKCSFKCCFACHPTSYWTSKLYFWSSKSCNARISEPFLRELGYCQFAGGTKSILHFTIIDPLVIEHKNVMQNNSPGYLYVLQQVCKFLEVSCLSFLPEYGPKLKEDYVSVGHLPKIQKDRKKQCCSCGLFNCCKSNWQKVSSFLQLCFVLRYFVVVFELLVICSTGLGCPEARILGFAWRSFWSKAFRCHYFRCIAAYGYKWRRPDFFSKRDQRT